MGFRHPGYTVEYLKYNQWTPIDDIYYKASVRETLKFTQINWPNLTFRVRGVPSVEPVRVLAI